jgi:putative ATPase
MNADLFDPESPIPHDGGRASRPAKTPQARPLADRLRPHTLDEIMGQAKLLAPDGPLRPLLESDRLPSLLLWGPPGSGKTTLARLAAEHADARFIEYSAVRVGARELKEVMAESEKLRHVTGQRTVLFLDEIHRFNKAQQDALLPWVERGDITLIGATTENPSFELNAALLSRLRLFVLEPIDRQSMMSLLKRALVHPRGLIDRNVTLTDRALDTLAVLSEGDARQALGLLDSVTAAVAERRRLGHRPIASETEQVSPVESPHAGEVIDAEDLRELIQHRAPRYDKQGEEHYNLISALHKSLRNSDVQAALYWLVRMLEGGEDPLYLARRMVRFASEDIGLADPHALSHALAARDAVHFIGLPEGSLALAQAVVYLALAPKSNAIYTAFAAVQREVQCGQNPPAPLHLRNAPTGTMRDLGYGRDYIYAHDTPEGIGAMSCLPEQLTGSVYYRPKDKGWERELARRMHAIEAWHERRNQPPDARAQEMRRDEPQEGEP